MTYKELTKRLTDSALFTADEVRRIMLTCGSAEIGNTVVSCELLGIKLTGADIDTLYQKKQPSNKGEVMAETKGKATPGPWEIEISRTGVEWPTIIAPREPRYDDGSAYIVCEIDESYPIGEETPQKELALANAALIASAPTLQARIKELEKQTSLITEGGVIASLRIRIDRLEAEKAELVEALKQLVNRCKEGSLVADLLKDNGQTGMVEPLTSEARAAIAKAEPS